jgi:ketopantoate hydroxymethyltransferase
VVSRQVVAVVEHIEIIPGHAAITSSYRLSAKATQANPICIKAALPTAAVGSAVSDS